MKKRIFASAHPLDRGIDSQTMVFYFSLSFVMHLIFIGSVIFWPESTPPTEIGAGGH